MDFGRIPDLGGVDWRLPPDHPMTTARLRAGKDAAPGVVRFGCPVWTHRGFLGKIYPPGTPPGRYLEEYARHFPVIELNTTWYGYDVERVRKWSDQTPEDFRFLPKLPREISHDLRFRDARGPLERFCDAMRHFGPRLGTLWTILPPSFGPSELPDLLGFVDAFPPDLDLAVELRDPAWFASDEDLAAVATAFARQGVGLVLCDVAGRRDVLHQCLTSDHLLIRFAGHHLDPSDYTRLDDWAVRLESWLRRGLGAVDFIFHQPQEHLGVELAMHLGNRLASLEPRRPQPRPSEDQGLLF